MASPGQTLRVMFAPRAGGQPVAFTAAPLVEVVNAAGFAPLGSSDPLAAVGGGDVAVAASGAPFHEYVASWPVPLATTVDTLLIVRITGTYQSNGQTLTWRSSTSERVTAEQLILIGVQDQIPQVPCP